MLLDGNVCFFVMYHYETSPILATPIPCLDLSSILAAYKKNFENLKEKGYKPKLNFMDNQAMNVISKLTLCHNKSASNLSSYTTTVLTQLREPSKPSKINSLVR